MGDNYSIGLDIGTGSVGWAVIGEDYRLKRAKGKNLIGVRLFDAAQTAADRRGYRTTRRRLSRRRWRLRLLNEIFAPELAKVDENFLARLKYSWVSPLDEQNKQGFQWQDGKWLGASLFGDAMLDRKFQKDYPTIYHLRNKLMQDDFQHDLREIYMALHHIVKYRGHFLIEGEVNAHNSFDVVAFINLLNEFKSNFETPLFDEIDKTVLLDALTNKQVSKSGRVEAGLHAFQDLTSAGKKVIKDILSGIVGNKIDFIKVFGLSKDDFEDAKQMSLSFADGEKLAEELEIIEGLTTAEQYEFVIALQSFYDGLTLKLLLGDDQSVAAAMVRRYKEHKEDLKTVKALCTKANKQDFEKSYLLVLKDNEDDRKKGFKFFSTLVENSDLENKAELLRKIEDGTFLPRQRTKANGSIPHQLHRHELETIIAKQSAYYPFLAETFEYEGKPKNKLAQLVDFRVPYYVGPLVTKQQTEGNDENHWMTRQTDETITPWNLSQVVDLDTSARDFIKRMTGTDTYLIGEPALHKASVFYQEFNVLQELNNVRVNGRPLEVAVKQDIFETVFKVKKSVSKRDLEDYFVSQGLKEAAIEGLADAKKFNSQLGSYHYFKDVFGIEQLDELYATTSGKEKLDEITEAQTVFEDKKVLRRQLDKFDWLTTAQKDKLQNKHYTGWGSLSKKLLTSKAITDRKLDLDTPFDKHSLLEALYFGTHNFSFYINNTDESYGFRQWVDAQNTSDENGDSVYTKIQELAGDKKIKRGIAQSFHVIDDIVRALGHNPDKIYLEFAREKQESRVTNSRLNYLKSLIDNDPEFKTLKTELADKNKEDLQNDRLYLYFIQQGKDLYTGESLNLDNLSNYDVDHIIPQAMTKDNSFDNRVLVKSEINRLKTNAEVVPTSIRQAMAPFWRKLHSQGFISKRKLDNLMRESINDRQKERFIARSLVETRQIIKNVANLIDSEYPDTTPVVIRQELTGDMRRYVDKKKNRDINDFHHAHDALLIATVGTYMQRREFMAGARVRDNANNEYNRYTKQWLQEVRDRANGNNTEHGDVKRVYPLGFVVGSMRAATVNDKTEKVTNKETREVVWSTEDYQYLLKVLEYKNILFSRRVKDVRPRLYAESLFSPKTGKKKLIPANKHKSSQIYGGFEKVEAANMMLLRINGTNRLVSVPVAIANQIDAGRLTYDEYASSLGIKKFEKLLLAPVYLNQRVSDQGQEFYLTTAERKHNAKQVWVNKETYDKTRSIDKLSEEELLAVFDELTGDAVKKRMKFYLKDLNHLAELRDMFINQSVETQQNVLKDLIYELHDDAGWRDPIKKHLGSKAAPAWTTLQTQDTGQGATKLSDDAEFIYQSATGIFERRVKIQDLL